MSRDETPPHKPRRRWPLVVGCLVAGAWLGAVAVIAAPALVPSDKETPPLAAPEKHVGGGKKEGPKLTGDLYTTIKNFTLEDPEGHTVLRVAKIGAFLDLDAVGDAQAIRMPRGHAEDIDVLLRRGPSGRVSLSEAFRGNSDPHEPKKQKGGTPLNIGPLAIKNVKMTVAMGKTPVIIQIDRAVIRIQRRISDLAPRIFLSEVHGSMLKPDPLPQPIAIEGAEGIIDLAEDPLIDLRARVCLGNSEMRIRIGMPARKEKVQMTVDATGPLAKSALAALNLVSLFKGDKIGVDTGSVKVEEPFECSRDKGDEKRAKIDSEEGEQGADAEMEGKESKDKPEPNRKVTDAQDREPIKR